MGALAPVYHWIPEDDLLLKNAVEAGASLESLAKGAIQFSRRFTVPELQNRWNSLLYDPVVSAEASAHMIEFERSVSSLPSQSSRLEIARGNKQASGKRKDESIRKCYAMRKRICNEPFGSMDMNFLVPEGNTDFIGDGNEFPSENCMFEDPIPNPAGIQDSNFDMAHHDFPEFVTGGTTATSFGYTTHASSIGLKDCVEDLVDQNNMPKDLVHTFEENLSHIGNCCMAQELDQPNDLPVCSQFEADNIEAEPLAMFDQIHISEEMMCSEFVGGQVFRSPIPDSGTLFQNPECSCPVPHVPNGNIIGKLSPSTFPDAHNTQVCHLDGTNLNCSLISGFDVCSNANLKCQISCELMKNSTPSTQDFLAELSNTLLDSTDEDEFAIDKTYIDGLTSLWLDSPSDGDVNNITISEASEAPDDYISKPGIMCPGELDEKGRQDCVDVIVESSEAQVLPSASDVKPIIACSGELDHKTQLNCGNVMVDSSVTQTLPSATAESYSMECSGGLDEKGKYIFGDAMVDRSAVHMLPSASAAKPSIACPEGLDEKGQYNGCDATADSSVAQIPSVSAVEEPNIAYHGELDNKGQHKCRGAIVDGSVALILPSASSVNPNFPELRNGVICCTLNTEDTEVPCNEDVFFRDQIPSSSHSSATHREFCEAFYPSSSYVAEFLSDKKTSSGGCNLMKRNPNCYEQPNLSSQMSGTQLLSEMGINFSGGDCGLKSDLSYSGSHHVACMNASTVPGGQCQIKSENESACKVILKKEVTNFEQAMHLSYDSADSYLKKQAHGLDNLQGCDRKIITSCKTEVDFPAAIYTPEVLLAESGSMEMADPEAVLNLSPSDQEEFLSGSDDVPNFSDVEAMILDMDLIPDDQEFYSRRQVSKYQQKDTKRAIVRLEQAADAYMQRAIASQGALAVLYGRRSKHYIKKSKVLLGRATEDISVDIDLGREGCGNKISRRQALIMMDKGGSFHLENLGKFPIFINSKEVAPKESLNLSSSCLIEFRGTAFVFETNRTRVRQYTDDIDQRSQSREQKVLIG